MSGNIPFPFIEEVSVYITIREYSLIEAIEYSVSFPKVFSVSGYYYRQVLHVQLLNTIESLL